MKKVENLNDAKEGDIFYCEQYSFSGKVNYYSVKVEKVSNKEVVINGRRYKKDNAREVGNRNGRELLYPCDEIKKSILVSNSYNKLRSYPWHLASDDFLIKVAKLIKEYEMECGE